MAMYLNPVLAALLSLTLLHTSSAQGNTMNPCHEAKEDQTADCPAAFFPNTLCQHCLLNETNVHPDGTMIDCTAFYIVDTPECIRAFETYVAANPCDTKRAEWLDLYQNGASAEERERGRVGLDYFAYSVCEECCDCIPWGASLEDAQVQGFGEIYESRGNCPAHYVYDICNILPNMTSFGVALVGEAMEAAASPAGEMDGGIIANYTIIETIAALEALLEDDDPTNDADATLRLEKVQLLASYNVTELQRLYQAPEGVQLCGKGVGLFNQWLASDNSSGWATAQFTGMDDEAILALKGITSTFNCRDISAWTSCHSLETKQQRI